MKYSNLASIFISLFLVWSVFAEEKFQEEIYKDRMVQIGLKGDEPKHTTGTGYSAGFSHGGVYGGGQICKWGCCSESYGYSHTGGGYYSCTCCATAAEAKAYKAAEAKNNLN